MTIKTLLLKRSYHSFLTTIFFVASSLTPCRSSFVTVVRSTCSGSTSYISNSSASSSGLKMTTASSTSRSMDPLSNLNLPSPLILGSGSFTRKLILQEMNIPFVLKVKPIDEQSIGDRSEGSDPSKLVMTLAMAKNEALITALVESNQHGKEEDKSREEETKDNNVTDEKNDIAEKYNLVLDHDSNLKKECIVLTADQVVTHSTSILEKPRNIEQAKDFVKRYAFSPPSTVGAVVMTHLPSGISVSGVDISTIHFKSDIQHANLVDKLLEDGAPVLSCAGGLMVEHPFVMEFIEEIDGTQDGVMGLSKDLVTRLLMELREKLDDTVVGPGMRPEN